MIEINLVPDVKQELLKAQRQRSAVVSIATIVGIGFVGAAILMAMYVYGFQGAMSGIADRDIEKENKELQSVTDLSKTLTIQNQLKQIETISASKEVKSRLFDVLQATVPPSPNEVTISRLVIDSESRAITIEAQAINSYPAAEIFKKSVESAEVIFSNENGDGEEKVRLASDASIADTNYGEDSNGAMTLRFTLTFTYAEELFDASIPAIRIVKETTGNVTDSYLGIPRSIFADRIPEAEEEQR